MLLFSSFIVNYDFPEKLIMVCNDHYTQTTKSDEYKNILRKI